MGVAQPYRTLLVHIYITAHVRVGDSVGRHLVRDLASARVTKESEMVTVAGQNLSLRFKSDFFRCFQKGSCDLGRIVRALHRESRRHNFIRYELCGSTPCTKRDRGMRAVNERTEYTSGPKGLDDCRTTMNITERRPKGCELNVRTLIPLNTRLAFCKTIWFFRSQFFFHSFQYEYCALLFHNRSV